MRARRRQPQMLRPHDPPVFADPELFDGEGLVAVGGDLAPERLLAAYSAGLFPWFAEGYVPMWWSPDPRALLDPQHLRVATSLRRVLRRAAFVLTWDRCFERVMRECGRGRDDGTWIIPEMITAYSRLHRLGHAHSLEVWADGELVGGIYGVQVGGLFAAESMFHLRTDMSKVALVALVRSVHAAGIELFDVQFATDHLRRLGAFEVPRAVYLSRVAAAVAVEVDLSNVQPTVGDAV